MKAIRLRLANKLRARDRFGVQGYETSVLEEISIT
jgi:hypothetical protein